jgi:ribosome modulation factor
MVKHHSGYEGKAHQTVYQKGANARLANEPRVAPYKDVSYAKAWRDGWDRMELAIKSVAEGPNHTKPSVLGDPRGFE